VNHEIESFIKQETWKIDERNSWYTISERMAAKFGMAKWSLLRLFPVDLGVDRLEGDDHG
jgi:hypothetical protein